MTSKQKLKYCAGCRDNYYNQGEDRCWSFDTATTVWRKEAEPMTDIQKAIDDLIDAADILVSRRDHVTGDVALIPRTSISRLEVALEQAHMAMVGRRTAGRLLDGEIWDEYPEVR